MTQCARVAARDFEHIHVKETDVRSRLPRDFLHNPQRIRTLNLVPEDFSPPLIDSRPLVAFCGCIVAARLQVILHPTLSGRAPDEIESIWIQIKQNRVANHVSVMVTRDELFGLIDFEIFKAIDAKVREQFERVRPFDIEVGHVV